VGEVTWSSTTSGLRSQREYTMTCVSLRSGTASSGIWRSDHQPAAAAAIAIRMTAPRWVADHSITRSIIAEAWRRLARDACGFQSRGERAPTPRRDRLRATL